MINFPFGMGCRMPPAWKNTLLNGDYRYRASCVYMLCLLDWVMATSVDLEIFDLENRHHPTYFPTSVDLQIGVSIHGGTPSSHPFQWGFPEQKPSSYWSAPILGNHHIRGHIYYSTPSMGFRWFLFFPWPHM